MGSPKHKTAKVLSHLGELSLDAFFKDYWQQKPLLARQALPNFHSPLDAEEIAGFCLEDDIESRLVIQNETNENDWQVQHGPLDEKIFSQLPERLWSILVQHADSLDPSVNAMLDHFRFIPNWRLDDIMVSYAVDGGGVGPHFDYYDVFLLQGQGKRRWRIGQTCNAESALVPNQPMKILEEFTTCAEHILEPGDLLYIPANVAHWGEAIGESITYSIGFRAPSYSEFILDYSQDLAAACNEDLRFKDRTLTPKNTPGLITDEVIEQFKEILLSQSCDAGKLGRWIGAYSTRLKQDISGMYPSLSLNDLRTDTPCSIHPHARVAYFRENTAICCFINGASADCSEDLATVLSEKQPLRYSDYNAQDQGVLEDLMHSNLLVAIKALDDIF